jgi:hypothetical protein
MLEGDIPIDTPEASLWSRMSDSMPGLAASAGFSSKRGSSTLLRGGYMDNPSMLGKGVDARRAAKFRTLQSGSMNSYESATKQFFGGAKRNQTMASLTGDARKSPFLRSSRLNNASLRPRNLGRYHSLSIFADSSEKAYTPFGASGFIGNTKTGKKAIANMGIELKEGESAFGPGLLSGISAGRRVDMLEAKAFNKGSSRAARKLAKADNALGKLGKMNNPTFTKPTVIRGSTGMGAGYTAPYSNISYGASFSDDAMRYAVTGKNAGQVGVRGNMYASSLSGAGTTYLAGYARGAQGFGGVSGLTGRALEGATRAEGAFGSAFAKAFGDDGLKFGGQLFKGAEGGINLLRGTGGKVLFRELGASATGKLAVSGAGKMLATRGAALAIPGIQVLAAASFIYDIGQMAGEVVKSGINLAKDANKSLQGSIAKPAFGMGYKDTEAAATSRSRGVQAIQNSRLNARSALGAEGAMMAAHYG